jgi:hypothetical protein
VTPAAGVRGEFDRRALEPDSAGVQHDYPLAERHHLLGLVGGQQYRAALAQLGDHLAEPQPLLRIEAHGRLVEDE